ncbi:hypothetical protein HDU98_001441, partial [Podochytrium sp. JEL0797]
MSHEVLALKTGVSASLPTGVSEVFRRPTHDVDLKAAVAGTGIDAVAVYRQHHLDWKPSQRGINRQCKQKSRAKKMLPTSAEKPSAIARSGLSLSDN